MTKMTRQAAIELLKNRKVYVNGKSAEIQRKLFELEWRWRFAKEAEVNYDEMPFIYIYGDGTMTFGVHMHHFMNHKTTEISADEIISIEVEPEYDFKPFDKVLVRNGNNEPWVIEFFEKYITEKALYSCMCARWMQCIPYEGNEKLLGTRDTPNK